MWQWVAKATDELISCNIQMEQNEPEATLSGMNFTSH